MDCSIKFELLIKRSIPYKSAKTRIFKLYISSILLLNSKGGKDQNLEISKEDNKMKKKIKILTSSFSKCGTQKEKWNCKLHLH